MGSVSIPTEMEVELAVTVFVTTSAVAVEVNAVDA
jgi:hypothetical protein